MIALRPDPSCRYNLSWVVEAAPPHSCAALVAALKAASEWLERTQMDILVRLEHQEGHELLFVPATERTQLRLHYLTPRAEREVVAKSLEDSFAALP